jgi:hypothetical protein
MKGLHEAPRAPQAGQTIYARWVSRTRADELLATGTRLTPPTVDRTDTTDGERSVRIQCGCAATLAATYVPNGTGVLFQCPICRSFRFADV